MMDDLDDSVSNTEDDLASPRKRRRSWKGHRIGEELGLYACDQCDKQFSKQSSLARHKYEHSGNFIFEQSSAGELCFLFNFTILCFVKDRFKKYRTVFL